jgi:hypothetical protein
MILHKESHTDHISPEVLEWVLQKFQDRDTFFIETVELPEELPQLECGLYGPIMGDAPVTEEEVTYKARVGRDWVSRLVDQPTRSTRNLTVIGGPYEGYPCVLFTAFGGPPSPKELNDPTLEYENQGKSQRFWSEHALSM